NQHENDQQSEGEQKDESLERSLLVFKLAGPLDVVAGRELDAFPDSLRCSADVACDIVGSDVDENEADKLAVFVADGWRTGFVGNVREHADGNLRRTIEYWSGGVLRHGQLRRRGVVAVHRNGDEDPFESVDILAKIAGVTNVYWVAFAAFDGGRDGLAANRC